MKATEIKNMPVDELNAKLDSLKEELFLHFVSSSQQISLKIQLALRLLKRTLLV